MGYLDGAKHDPVYSSINYMSYASFYVTLFAETHECNKVYFSILYYPEYC